MKISSFVSFFFPNRNTIYKKSDAGPYWEIQSKLPSFSRLGEFDDPKEQPFRYERKNHLLDTAEVLLPSARKRG